MKQIIKLKWKFLTYMLIFMISILVFILLFQTTLLDNFYKAIKVNAIKNAANNIADTVNDKQLVEYAENLSKQDDLCIRVVGSNDLYVSNAQGCPLSRLSFNDLSNYYVMAALNNGDFIAEESEGLMIYHADTLNPRFEIAENKIQNMTYIKLIENNLILIYGTTSLPSTTFVTLKYLMFIISIIVIFVTIILTLLLTKKFVRPIENINEAAKGLKEAKYENETEMEYLEAHDLNETLKDAAIDLQKAEKAKRDLLSNISHDLRTPLTMISGYGEMMIDLPNEKTDENIQVIIDESKRLNALVNDLILLSKYQDKAVKLNKTIFNLSKLLKDATFNYQRMNPDIEFLLEADEDVMVSADEDKIKQVVYNFLSNAINYGEAKPIHIILRNEDKIKVMIKDEGQGIAPEDIENIWDRYYKVDKAHFRSQSGSGIGLSIAKEILDQHQAKYGVESEIGKGSTFYFVLEKSND